MRYNQSGNTSLSMLSCLACALIMNGTANAQAKTGQNPSPHPSFSVKSKKLDNKGKSQPSVHLKEAGEEELADAILGQALADLVEQTDQHFHEGEYNHIINLNRVIVQGDIHNMDAYSDNLWLIWNRDDADEAIAFIKEGIQKNPKTYFLYDELGLHYSIRLKDHKLAIPYFLKATAMTDCPKQTFKNLAHSYGYTDQWAKAAEIWKKLVSFYGDDVSKRQLRNAQQKLAEQHSNK